MNNVYKMVLLFIWIIVCHTLTAQSAAILDEVNRPDSLIAGNGNLYITEGTTIYIYDLKTLAFKRKCGKAGEGPGEIKKPDFSPLGISTTNGKLNVSSMGKLSIFSIDGIYEGELKTNPNESNVPFGDKYITYASHVSSPKAVPVLAVFLSDQHFKRIKPLQISDIQVGPSAGFLLPYSAVYAVPYKDKIYVVDGKRGFVIKVFNRQGRLESIIERGHTPVKVDNDYRDKTLKWFKKDPTWKNFYPYIKNRIKFKPHFPAIDLMTVDHGRIYVVTFVSDKRGRECVVLDLKGNELGRVYLPLKILYGMEFTPDYSFAGDEFLQLRENIDEEAIELIRKKITFK